MAKKADEQELFTLAQDTIDSYTERDTDYDALEDYYFLDGEQDPTQDADDEAVDIVRLPYITNVVDLVQDLFASAEWSISVPAGGEKVTDQQLADDAEEYLKVVFSQSQRAQRQDFLSRAAWLVAMRGCLAGRVMRVNDWLKKDSGRLTVGDKIPLLIQMRDPRYVYPEFGLDGLSYVVEQFTRTVGDVRRTYGDDVLAKKKRDEEIEWTEYWDGTHFYHWAAGELVQSGEHLCGGIPYAYEFARQTGKIEPEKRGRLFLQGMTAVVDRMNTLASMESTFVSNYIGSAWAYYSERDEGRIDLRPGAVNRLDATDRLEPIQAGRKALDLDASWSKLETHWERGTFPGTVFGADPGRVMSGYSLNILNQSGRMRLQPMIACVERLLETLLSNVLMASEQWVSDLAGGKIPFYGYAQTGNKTEQSRKVRKDRAFDAKNLGGVYQVEVSLSDLLPADEQTNLNLALMARTPNVNNTPLLSDETVREKYLLVGRDVDERTRIDRERIELTNAEIAAIKEALAVSRRKEELAPEVKTQLKQTVEELLVSRVPVDSPMPPGAMIDGALPPDDGSAMGPMGGGMPMMPEEQMAGLMQGGPPSAMDEMPVVDELPPEMIQGVM